MEPITDKDLRNCLSFLESKYMVHLTSMETKPYYDHIIKECLWKGSYEGYTQRREYYEHIEYLFKCSVLSHYTVTVTPKTPETNFCYIKE